MGLLEASEMKKRYFVRDKEGEYLYHLDIVVDPSDGYGDMRIKMTLDRGFAIRFTKKYLAEAIAKAFKMEVQEV